MPYRESDQEPSAWSSKSPQAQMGGEHFGWDSSAVMKNEGFQRCVSFFKEQNWDHAQFCQKEACKVKKLSVKYLSSGEKWNFKCTPMFHPQVFPICRLQMAVCSAHWFLQLRGVWGLGMNAMILKSMGPAVHFPCLLDEVREKNAQ